MKEEQEEQFNQLKLDYLDSLKNEKDVLKAILYQLLEIKDKIDKVK